MFVITCAYDEVRFYAVNSVLCIVSRIASFHTHYLMVTPLQTFVSCLLLAYKSSNWNCCWRTRLLCSANHLSFFTSCLLLLSGDVEANPGPHYPCGHCAKSVRSNHPGIFCEVHYSWCHAKCIQMPTEEYTRLSTSYKGWCCQSALKKPSLFLTPHPDASDDHSRV